MSIAPKGGRGKKAPYETVQVRVPQPIKLEVEYLIAKYRESVLGGEDESENLEDTAIYEACLKLVDRFIDESGLTERLTSPRSQNLVKFRNWLRLRVDGK